MTYELNTRTCQLSMINVCIKYGEPRLYGKRETDLITIDHKNEAKVR